MLTVIKRVKYERIKGHDRQEHWVIRDVDLGKVEVVGKTPAIRGKKARNWCGLNYRHCVHSKTKVIYEVVCEISETQKPLHATLHYLPNHYGLVI